MAEKKLTKREMFEKIKSVITDADMVAFIDHELELLAKKNSADKKPTATQIANEGIKENILNVLGEHMTVTEVQKALDTDISNQRVSSLMRQLVADGKVARVEEKRKAYFSKVMA